MTDLEKLTPAQFDRFRDFIYRQSGIRMEPSKVTLVSNRIRRRLRAGGFADFDAYYRHLTSTKDPAELEQFLDAITTNETHFFRTPAHFDWFRGEFLTDLINRQRSGERDATLRVWSAACSTGEERIRWRSALPRTTCGCAAGSQRSWGRISATRAERGAGGVYRSGRWTKSARCS